LNSIFVIRPRQPNLHDFIFLASLYFELIHLAVAASKSEGILAEKTPQRGKDLEAVASLFGRILIVFSPERCLPQPFEEISRPNPDIRGQIL